MAYMILCIPSDTLFCVVYHIIAGNSFLCDNFALRISQEVRQAIDQHSSCFVPLYSLTIDHVLSIVPKIYKAIHNAHCITQRLRRTY